MRRGKKERSTRNDPKGKGKLIAGSYSAKEDDAYMGGEEDLIYRTNLFEGLFRRFNVMQIVRLGDFLYNV